MFGLYGDGVRCVCRQASHRVVWHTAFIFEPFPYKSFLLGMIILYNELIDCFDFVTHAIENGVSFFVECGLCGVEAEHIDGDEGCVSEASEFVLRSDDELFFSAYVEFECG